jgi:phosphohistidine swiveling domain-containing protein
MTRVRPEAHAPSPGEEGFQKPTPPTEMEWPVERSATRAVGQSDGVLSDLNFGEVFPFVCKPLARDYLSRYVGPLLASQFGGLPRAHPLAREINPMAFVAGRPYMDLSAYMTLPGVARHLGSLESADQTKGAAVVAIAKAGRLQALPLPLTSRWLLSVAYAFSSLRSAAWLLQRERPVKLVQAYRDRAEQLRAVARQSLGHKSAGTLLQDLDQHAYTRDDVTTDALRHLGVAFVLHGALQQVLADRVPSALLHDLGQGIPNDFTTEVSLGLWQLAVEARPLAIMFLETPPDQLPGRLKMTEQGRRWWIRFEEILNQHGHRGEVELDITAPRWREEPRFLLQTIANYLRHAEDQPSPAEMLRNGIHRRETAASAIRKMLPLPTRLLFNWLYARYVQWMPFREAGKYTWLLWLEFSRNVYRELGRRLVAEGQLHTIDDVFWLRLDELSRWATSGTIAWSAQILTARQEQWVLWSSLRPPSLLIGDRGAPEDGSATPAQSPPSMLRGTPASSGKAEGVARVMTDPADAELRQGEILVTRYTDPAWTPLFFTAGALITEVGGVLSHGAVVAREVGLPAIVGVTGATTFIRNGQRLRVNATEGTIELLD